MRPKPAEINSIFRRSARLALLLGRLIKRKGFLPSLIAAALRQRRRQAAKDAAEAERLERIRNPSEYIGK